MKNSDVYDEKNQSIKFRAYGYRSSSPIQNSKMYYNESGRNEYNTFPKKDIYELFDDDPLHYIIGDEGVYSSIADMEKWAPAWDSGIIVSRQTLSESFNPQKLSSGKLGKAGFSWLLGERNGLRITYQDGSWVGFRNIFLKIPERNLSVILLSNQTGLDTEKQRLDLACSVAQLYL